jgi:lipoyl(octanoyl) transferase
MAWRVLDTRPANGAWNMAVDEALMEAVRHGDPPVLRIYRWAPRCLSLGRNQPAAGMYDQERLASRGISVVRRLTGGRAVLHDRELTYSAIVREGELGSPRATYSLINQALVAGLRELGVDAELKPRSGRSPAPSLAPCFRDPAEGEVVTGGRKLIGSAQYRRDGVVLQHGSLLLEDDQREVPGLLLEPAGEPSPAPAVLADHLSPLPSWHELTKALMRGWELTIGMTVRLQEVPETDAARATELAGRYADMAWTWRR